MVIAWASAPRVGYESRGRVEVEICAANPDFKRLSEVIAKWLWYNLSLLGLSILANLIKLNTSKKARTDEKPYGSLSGCMTACVWLYNLGAAVWVAYEIAVFNE